jgi:hypothetical protein
MDVVVFPISFVAWAEVERQRGEGRKKAREQLDVDLKVVRTSSL